FSPTRIGPPSAVASSVAAAVAVVGATAAASVRAATTATAAIAVTAADISARADARVNPLRRREKVNGSSRTQTVLPPAQDLPVHGRERPEDRLQGHEAVAALHLRARQDRAEPHHRRIDQEAA